MIGRQKRLNETISSFTKAVNDLQVLQERNTKAVEENDAKITKIMYENTELLDEAERAEKVRQKLEALIA